MASKYAQDVLDAAADIEEDGMTVTYSREVSSGFDPATGVDSTSTVSFNSSALKTRYNRNEIDGTVIRRGDLNLLTEAVSGEPLIGMTVTVGAKVYRVMDVGVVDPDDTAIIYKVQIRI